MGRTTKATASAGGYDVGYGKPPTHSQFKKGQKSANPTGRPKGTTKATALQKALDKTITVIVNGKRVKMASRDAMSACLVTSAIKGDAKAAVAVSRLEILERTYEQKRQPTREEILREESERQRMDAMRAQALRMIITHLDGRFAAKRAQQALETTEKDGPGIVEGDTEATRQEGSKNTETIDFKKIKEGKISNFYETMMLIHPEAYTAGAAPPAVRKVWAALDDLCGGKPWYKRDSDLLNRYAKTQR